VTRPLHFTRDWACLVVVLASTSSLVVLLVYLARDRAHDQDQPALVVVQFPTILVWSWSQLHLNTFLHRFLNFSSNQNLFSSVGYRLYVRRRYDAAGHYIRTFLVSDRRTTIHFLKCDGSKSRSAKRFYMLLGMGSVVRATPMPWAELRSGVSEYRTGGRSRVPAQALVASSAIEGCRSRLALPPPKR
jgi:hypothetical protein